MPSITEVWELLKRHKHDNDLTTKLTGYLKLVINSYVRGGIFRIDSDKKVQELAVGSADEVLKSDGTDPAWGTVGHDELSDVGTDDHHAQAHTIASHSDTTGTGAELDELTDGSETTLHSHAGGGVKIATFPGSHILDDGDGTTEITLASATVPAGTLGTANGIMCKFFYQKISDSACGNRTITIRMDYGTTTVASITIDMNNAVNQTEHGFLECVILANGTTTSQTGTIGVQGKKDVTATDTALFDSRQGTGTATENSANALTFAITAQVSAFDLCNSTFNILDGYLIKID